MAKKILLKDQLFNAQSVGQLASEYASALPDFDAERFVRDALAGFAERELLARLDWLAACLEPCLADDFPTMADQLEAAMPPPLDPTLRDGDFGHFIHAVPGILAVRHGLEDHRERAFDLLYAATQRFSMEFYIRPFLNRWPDETLARLADWVTDDHYHVRRLVSEGTRPKLPWAKAVSLTPAQTLPLLDKLHGDPTRFVTRSVANHLNDIAKTDPDLVLDRLEQWSGAGQQTPKELDWLRRHALRTLIKQGHPCAMEMLGYARDLDISAVLELPAQKVEIGTALVFVATLTTPDSVPVLVDYVLSLTNAKGTLTSKVFKLKTARIKAGESLTLRKTHKLKADATTFRLYPGAARLALQVNGRVTSAVDFELVAAATGG